MLSGLLGIGSETFNVTSSTSAQFTAQSVGSNTVDLTGKAWGDPHIVSADPDDSDSSFYVTCPDNGWSNAFSDYEVEFNVSCNLGWGGHSLISDIAMVLGGHYVLIQAGSSWNPTGSNRIDFVPWTGWIQVDGVVTNPTTAGTFALLNDTAQNITVTEVIGQPNVGMTYSNYVIVKTSSYTVIIDYAVDNTGEVEVYDFRTSNCETPGGFLGQTFTTNANTVFDTNGSDFDVPSEWYLSPEYSVSCSGSTTNRLVSTAKITQ